VRGDGAEARGWQTSEMVMRRVLFGGLTVWEGLVGGDVGVKFSWRARGGEPELGE